MDQRTRIRAAINRLPVDQIPCAELVITDELVRELCGQPVIEFEHRLEFVQRMELDAICLHPCTPLSLQESLVQGKLEFIDLAKWGRSNLFTFAVLDGPIGWSGKLFSFEDLMRKLARRNSEMADIVTAVEKLNLAAMERLAGSGVNGILLADDIAFNQGLIARPALLRSLLISSYARQVEYAKKLELPIFFHSDGNLMAVMDDIVAAGFDGLQCIEKMAGMDIGSIKQQYGHKLCLWGNLDPAELLSVRSYTELAGQVEQIVRDGGSGGGLIFGTSSGLFERMNLESIQIVYKVAKSTVI